ncbi:serine hydrolase domain-containing protein [Dyella telluris]|uniref:Beta-lactamase family protein n=1 Tax=Dyella telluris TaxID=2763498 RepID=A0A7G8Q921_9GAMM|nr:serine hydrolase domain-containing protein [Dyella telluris]QNK03279.1 beta-lactamase family protein [Dyella telluris]
MGHVARFVLCAFALALPVAHASAPEPAARADIDPLIDAVVARYHLPGIAVGVIDDGKVVYTRTEGKLASGQPMDADTLFGIASNSKAMTSTLLARLVQQGKLRWDDPVRKYMPSFRMADAWVTANMQVGDLLVHHSGLPEGAGDLMLWPTPNQFTPADVVAGLQYLKPSYSFRAGYAYDNTLYIVAGEVAAAAGGTTYPALLRREVFQPLGMSRCQIGTWNRDDVGNVADPHVLHDGRFVAEPADGSIVHPATMDSAGGVRCSLNDMLTWATNWLVPTPAQLAWLTPEQRRKEWTPYTPMPISARRRAWDGTLFYGYGYGWRIADVDGQITVSHTGTLSGMYSAMVLLPFRKSGFVVLINADAEEARSVLIEVLAKHFTAPGKARSVASYADELDHENQQKRTSHVPDTSSRKAATPAELAAQLGVWRDPWFGEARLCAQGDTVRFASVKSPRLSGQVMRVGDRYLVQWDNDEVEAWLRLPAQPGGAMHMAKVDPDADFSSDYEDLAFNREHACH